MICAACGERADAVRVAEPGLLVCSRCGHGEPFARLPLFCLTGPSGTGKSTMARLLVPRLAGRVVLLEQDLLWQPGLDDPTDEHRLFRSTWLRLAAAIGQSGRPVLLCGTVVPPELEVLPERALFTRIHYLALTCEAGALAARLWARPAWRRWDEPRIAEMLDHAAWLTATASRLEPPVELLDTTDLPPAEVAERVETWLGCLSLR
nr:AAA family ATPase [Pseudonocardia asaccharolytica]